MRFDFTPASRMVLGVAVLMIGGALLAISTPGCRKPPPPKREYTIAGRVIEVPLGHTFSVRLASNPSSGYEWQIQEPVPTGTILELMSQAYDESRGEQVFTFRAAGAGAVQIPIKYTRVGAPRTSVGRIETFKVVVD